MNEKDQYKTMFQSHLLFEQFADCCRVNYNLEGFTKTQVRNFYMRKFVEEATEVLAAFNRTEKKAYPDVDQEEVERQIREELGDAIICWIFAVFSCGDKPSDIFEIAVRKLAKKHAEKSKIIHPKLQQFLTVE